MYRNKLDLVLKICMLPFTDYEFYKEDFFVNLCTKNDIESYNKEFLRFCSNIYKSIHLTQKIHNLDEINLLIEKFFPKVDIIGTNNINIYYLNHLYKLSKFFITHRNGNIALKYWESEKEEDFLGPYKGINKIALWNSLNRMFNTDILVIMYLLSNGMDDEKYLNGYYSQISIDDLQLQQVLRKGISETHLHASASVSFLITWTYMMNNPKEDYYDLLNDIVIYRNYDLGSTIKAMILIRIIIAEFLKNRETKFDNRKFIEYARDEYLNNEGYEIFYNILTEVYKGHEFLKDEYLYNILFENIKKSIINYNLEYGQECIGGKTDVLGYIFQYNIPETTLENIFLFKALKYIYYEKNYEDDFFCKIFWQYIRIKNEVFQLKTQGNLIRGLDHFVKYFNRSTDKYSDDDEEAWNLRIKNQIQIGNMKKLEFRIAPSKEKSESKIEKGIRKKIRVFLKVYKQLLQNNLYKDKVPIMGLVFHFIKRPDNKEFDKCWINYSLTNNDEAYFEKIRQGYLRQMRIVNRLREKILGLSYYIVGIDAASIENNTEPWVFAPVYRECRDSSTNKLLYVESDKLYPMKNLGFTFHVGEEFRHLLSGLRHIDEVIQHFQFHAGDRIGHGIALGVNAEKWVKRNQVVTLPRIEYLENLLWIWGLHKNGEKFERLDISYLEQEIMRYAEKIYIKIDGITVYNLWKAYQSKFKEFKVNENYIKKLNKKKTLKNKELFCLFADSDETKMWNEDKLRHSQHCKCYLKNMLQPIQVEVTDKILQLIEQAQKIVCFKVSSKGVVVETNPTSNATIGEIDNIFDHYISDLNKRGLTSENEISNRLIITINSDDPSVFNTSVSNEFAYIFYSLLEKGYSRSDILLWIDKVREYGMLSSFVDDRNLDTKARIEEIEQILEEL